MWSGNELNGWRSCHTDISFTRQFSLPLVFLVFNLDQEKEGMPWSLFMTPVSGEDCFGNKVRYTRSLSLESIVDFTHVQTTGTVVPRYLYWLMDCLSNVNRNFTHPIFRDIRVSCQALPCSRCLLLSLDYTSLHPLSGCLQNSFVLKESGCQCARCGRE